MHPQKTDPSRLLLCFSCMPSTRPSVRFSARRPTALHVPRPALQSSTWNNKGYALRKQQKYNLALECYREAVRIQPGYAKAWYNMGYVLDKLGNYEASLDAFDHAIELAPDNEKYVASRKAVEATWREFQSVFDNSSVTSASSAATNASSVSASHDSTISAAATSSIGAATSGLPSGPQQQNTSSTSSASNSGNVIASTSPVLSHASVNASSHRRRSGSAPNGEIPASSVSSISAASHLGHPEISSLHNTGLGPVDHTLSVNGAHQKHTGDTPSQTPLISPNLSVADFNPFLDFETSALSLSTVSELTSSAPPTISRPTTPPALTSSGNGLSGTPLPPISSSMPDASSPMLSALHAGGLPGLSPQQTAQFNADHAHFLRSSQSSLIGSGAPPALNQGLPTDSQAVVLQPTGRMSLEEAHYAYVPHISHLRSSSHNVSNSSPALQLSHHADRHHSVPSSSGSNHGSRTPHSHRSANGSADESSSSSTGSNGENAVATAQGFTIPQFMHARSLSATPSPRGQNRTQTQLPSSSASSNGSSSQSAHVDEQKVDLTLDGTSLTEVDTQSLLSTIQSSMLSSSQQIVAPGATGGPLSGSPEASDSEQDRVHVGLPRARTYLEAIYSHLQNVKTVKDAEKLEKALEEMLAAVRVKRAFLNTKAENEDKCACCWERPPEMVCIPCGHLCICEECKYQLRQKKCPICSQPVKNIYKVFK